MKDTKEERKGWLIGRGKLFNFRPVLAISSGFGLGIFLCYVFSLHALWIGLIIAAVGSAAFLLFRKREKGALRALLFAAFLFFMFCLGALSFSARLSAFCSDNVEEGTYTVSATVKDIAGKNNLYLTDAMITDGDSVRALRGNIRVYAEPLPDEIGIGTKVSFECELKLYDTSAYGRFNATPILENTRYMASVSGNKISVRGEKVFDLFYAARERLRNVLFGTMREEEASISYAMMTGDGSAIESGLLQNFRYGGVAHIFAVSGLHIGVIYALLYFLLKRIRMPKLLRCALIFAPLLFYVGVCRFSPSSVRALVMCTVLMLSSAAGLKYDALNSIALAALVVLIIDPVYLMTLGFLLSVAAAGGIILLGGTFSRALKKIKCPEKLASSAGVCLAAQVSSFPLLLDSFGYVSALSLITNLLFIPVISGVYAILFFASVVACVLPAASGVLLYLPEILVTTAVFPMSVLDMKVLLISGFFLGGYIALWYFILAIVSDKINLRLAPKAVVCLLLSFVLICGVAVGNGAFERGSAVYISGDYKGSFVYIRSEGDYLVSFGKPSASFARLFSIRYRLKKVNGLIVLGDEKQINAAVPVVQSEIPAAALYAAKRGDYQQSFHSLRVENPQGDFYLGTARLRFFDESMLFVELGGVRYLFVGKDGEGPAGEFDVAVSVTAESLDGVRAREKICFENASDKISVRDTGDLQIRAKDGIIFVKRRGIS